MKKLNLIGEKYNLLTVVKEGSGYISPSGKSKGATWICKCDCGNTKEVRAQDLKSNHVKSCGCLVKSVAVKTNTKHGKCYTKEYRCWHNIKDRCCNPNSQGYKSYGARGITICDRWADSFEAFYEDVGPAPNNKRTTSLDRIDNNGNYEPGNVRWVTQHCIQGINQRTPKNNTSGCKGVSRHKDAWEALISVEGKRIRLGRFKSKEEAIKARLEAEEKYYKPLLESSK